MPKKQRKSDENDEEIKQMTWTEYHNYQTIYAWLDSLKAEFSDFVTIEEIGKSYENRPIKLIKISKKTVN
jgi:hypothetical protein